MTGDARLEFLRRLKLKMRARIELERAGLPLIRGSGPGNLTPPLAGPISGAVVIVICNCYAALLATPGAGAPRAPSTPTAILNIRFASNMRV